MRRISTSDPPDDRSELLKGTLDLLVLKVVAARPIHGYAISQRIRQRSQEFFAVPQGSLYPALHRLEDRGWLKAEWRTTETGREAKFYGLTPRGRAQLDTAVRTWNDVARAVRLVLQTPE